MKRFSTTKCLLAAAVALAIPSLASAADVGFATPGANKYSSSVIVNQNSELTVNPFVIAAGSTLERIGFDDAGLVATDQLLVSVVLSNAEVVNTTAGLPAVADTFAAASKGDQLAGTLVAGSIAPVADGNNGFSYSVTGVTAAASANAGDWVIRVPKFQVKNVTGPVTATVTLRKGLNVILTGSAVVADIDNGNPVVLARHDSSTDNRDISSVDVDGIGNARKVYADGIDGTDAETLYNAGGFTLSVRSNISGVGSYSPDSTPANNLEPLGADGVAFRPGTAAEVKVRVTGSNFAPWLPASGGYAAANIWLDKANTCVNFGTAADTLRLVNAESNNSTLVFSGTLASTHFLGGLSGTAGTVDAYLCFGVPSVAANEMVPQTFSSATVSLDYKSAAISNGAAYSWSGLRGLGFTGLTRYFHSVSPAGNPRNDSILRVVNHNSDECVTRVHGKRDNGSITEPLVIALPAGGSIDIASAELESGSNRFEGSLGGGQVRWQLRASSECNNADVFVIQRNMETGTLSNLHEADPTVYTQW